MKNLDLITSIREFNRFYTNILGLLDQYILDSDYSLTEARVLFELNTTPKCTANTLSTQLKIDKSYISRIITNFENNKLIRKKSSSEDNRISYIILTKKGEKAIEILISRSNDQIEELISHLNSKEIKNLSKAMYTIKKSFTQDESLIIKPFTEKDINFVIYNQIKLYELEYGLNTPTWKTYVADGVKKFVDNFDPQKDCMYILWYNEEPAGCIAITHIKKNTAQLRFFFIEKKVRGMGAGKKLITKAIDFCNDKNYKHVILWTFSTLGAARHLYEKQGFHITKSHENSDWGSTITEECWDLKL